LWEAAGNVGLALSNRQYFAQQDYLRTASAAWSGVRPLKTFLQLSVAQRARSAQILPGASESGAASGNLLAAGFGVRADQLGLTFSAGTEFRRGTYERDLSLATADRIFPEPYQLLITKLAAAKKYTWQRAAGEASVEAALELVQRSGQAASAGLAELLGMGSVSYLQVSFPWAGNLRQEMIIVSATGAERDGYPNQYVESVCHNELIWSFQPDGDAAFRLGYSVMPQEDGTKAENLYAVLGGKAGWANWSLTYGKGTLRQFTERPYLLAGQWQGPELNPGTAIAGKPWESWYSGSVAFGNKQTLSDLLTVRFWYSF
jgi:hypothetical protein